MNNNNILSEKTLFSYDQKKIDDFVKDLHTFMHIYKSIYDDLDTDFSSIPEKNKKKFSEVVKSWNQKYHNIAMQLDSKFKLKVYFNIELEIIKNIAKNMIGFSRFEISEDEKTLTAYFDEENTLTLESVRNFTQLIFLEDDMLNSSSPEFRMCTILGLSSFDKNIDLDTLFRDFSFSSSEDTVNWYNINRGYADFR